MRDQTQNAVRASPMTSENAAASAPNLLGPRTIRGFAIATFAAPLLAMMGALGTDALPFWPRLAYWLILMESGAVIGLGVSLGVEHWGRFRHRPWIEMALMAFLIALPLTLVVVGTSSIFYRTLPPGPITLLTFLGIVFVISFVITMLNYFMRLPGEAPAKSVLPPIDVSAVSGSAIGAAMPAAAPMAEMEVTSPIETAAPPPLAPRFADRLPLHLRESTIIALAAEDHYLRVYTGAGSALILMRLSDAVAELKSDPSAPLGAQTHRSWWVAQTAIQGITRNDGRATLTLAQDISAPVSRSHYKSLSEAGWFRK